MSTRLNTVLKKTSHEFYRVGEYMGGVGRKKGKGDYIIIYFFKKIAIQ